MSKMISFTVTIDGQRAVVSWSEEYGWIRAGDLDLLEKIEVEERESRLPTSIIAAPGMTIMPGPKIAQTWTDEVPEDDEVPATPGRCFTCGCPESRHIPGDGCEAHGCRTFVP